jgi:hypothetical protein
MLVPALALAAATFDSGTSSRSGAKGGLSVGDDVASGIEMGGASSWLEPIALLAVVLACPSFSDASTKGGTLPSSSISAGKGFSFPSVSTTANFFFTYTRARYPITFWNSFSFRWSHKPCVFLHVLCLLRHESYYREMVVALCLHVRRAIE